MWRGCCKDTPLAPDPTASPGSLIALFTRVAIEAGELAMPYFRHGERTRAGIETKHGGSPVTEADFLVDRFLKRTLEAAIPEAAWLSEETADTNARLSARRVLIVDPIDGTRAFMTGDPRW